jgi:hypothetical protein
MLDQHSLRSPMMTVTHQGTPLGTLYFVKPMFRNFSNDLGNAGPNASVITLSENMVLELEGRTIISRYLATLIAKKVDRNSANPGIKIKRSVVDLVISSEKPGQKASLSLENLAVHLRATSLDTFQKLSRHALIKHLMDYLPSLRQCHYDQVSDTFIVFNTYESSRRPLKEEYDHKIFPALFASMELSTDFPETIEI